MFGHEEAGQGGTRRRDRLVVAYVLRKFPKLSETFVLNEILGLEALGVKVHVYSLMTPSDPYFHDDITRLKAAITYVPGPIQARDRRSLHRTNRDAARSHGRAYWRTLARAAATGRPSMLWRFYQAGWIAERARRLGVSHYHAHFATRATTVAQLVSSITGRPYSFTAHAVDIYRDDVDPGVLRHKIANARFVASVSDSNIRHLEDVCGRNADKLVLQPNGIDMTRFVANGPPVAPPFSILSVGRLVEKKGGRYLVEACRLLRRRGLDFRCEIIGRGNLRQPLLEQIRRAGLEDRVLLLGSRKQKDVLKRYRSSYVYAQPSIVGSDGNREGLPVSIVEALACGVPVVSTPVTGIPEVVRDGHNGMLVPERDPEALAAALQRLIEDRALYERMRAQARESVLSRFDAAATSERLRHLFSGARA